MNQWVGLKNLIVDLSQADGELAFRTKFYLSNKTKSSAVTFCSLHALASSVYYYSTRARKNVLVAALGSSPNLDML